jgi:hypothetical protein
MYETVNYKNAREISIEYYKQVASKVLSGFDS